MNRIIDRQLVDASIRHYGWDNRIEPALTVVPGEIVEFETIDAGGGQISRTSTVDDVAGFDFDKINPTFGPVYVEGAEPGDALEITVISLESQGWGWTANIPGFGLLAEEFQDPALHIWEFDADNPAVSDFKPGGRVPLKLFPGILGNARPEPGCHSVVNPGQFGGNMDTRDICEGATLLLPVGVEGALFSCGDGHAAQGDGEICGTAIEAPMNMVLKFDLVKSVNLSFPRFSTPGPVTRHFDRMGYEVTMAMGPDLMVSAKNAVRDMVQYISESQNMAPVDAYMLLSVCADLRISEIVDDPDWVVSCYFPKVVFES